jgi:hypothetical protein
MLLSASDFIAVSRLLLGGRSFIPCADEDHERPVLFEEGSATRLMENDLFAGSRILVIEHKTFSRSPLVNAL